MQSKMDEGSDSTTLQLRFSYIPINLVTGQSNDQRQVYSPPNDIHNSRINDS